ncbi:IS3 family transposase [Glaciecola sp. HTCC2999]|uniref:IS3 family transposase n=1 Tax=Glaciecola sp. HTCC2999 TaxID=455436 RepID=UPI0018DCC595|nr:IS3 family transposase [Glaciecola sp. HTCC2999]
MLEILGLARSVYYYHVARVSAADKYADVKACIKTIYHEHKGRYGYRRIMYTLRQHGHYINHKTVQRLMQQLGLKSTVRPKRYNSYRHDADNPNKS